MPRRQPSRQQPTLPELVKLSLSTAITTLGAQLKLISGNIAQSTMHVHPYAAWPARHRESNHFIKMIGLVREISSQKIRRQLAWTYSDPTLQVWNLAQTKSYLVKLAKVNSTKKHKAARCSHFSWKCNIRCWCVYAHISVHNPAFLARRFIRRWQSALTSATRTNTGKLTTRETNQHVDTSLHL